MKVVVEYNPMRTKNTQHVRPLFRDFNEAKTSYSFSVADLAWVLQSLDRMAYYWSKQR